MLGLCKVVWHQGGGGIFHAPRLGNQEVSALRLGVPGALACVLCLALLIMLRQEPRLGVLEAASRWRQRAILPLHRCAPQSSQL